MNCFKIILFLTTLLVSCKSSLNTDVDEPLNSRASLPESFQFSKMHLKVIGSSIDKNEETMSILYGNAKVVERFRTFSDSITAGEELTLLTWKQKEDGHWLGGKIPDRLRYLEKVTTARDTDGKLLMKYEKYQGSHLVRDVDTFGNRSRITFLLSQKPSIMP
jgi:hypothetical protein